MRVLIVEDDRDVAQYVGRGLEEEGNSVTLCFDGAAGLRAAETNAFDVMLLDIMLPRIDGLELTRRLRAKSIQTPILLLTARDSATDIVRGLDAGADDYLTKPFSFPVLLARLRARTRFISNADQSRLRYGVLLMDLGMHEVWRDSVPLRLTKTEFSLLEYLIRCAGRVATRRRLIEEVWGNEREIDGNNLDVFIRFLRAKVDLPGQTRLIHTVRGIGYRLREDGP